MSEKVAPIRSEDDYSKTISRINDLLRVEPRSVEDEDELEVLSILADDWENRTFERPTVTAGQALEFLMESNDLTANEIALISGTSASRVYEYLNDKRAISDAVAIKLGERFKLDPKVFKTIRDSRRAS